MKARNRQWLQDPAGGGGWRVLRPIVEVGSADGWSGLGCYIQVVGIGSYGEKKGCKNHFLGLMLPPEALRM